MAGETPVLTPIRFGPFELFVESGELRKDGVRLKLSGQPIQVLSTLVASPGKLVTREELQHQLWPASSFGDFEKGLNAAVNRLRENLNDSAHDPKYIETLPGRGYRFIGKVETPPSEAPLNSTAADKQIAEVSEQAAPVGSRRRKGWAVITFAAGIVILLAAFLWMKLRSGRPPIGSQPIRSLAVLPLTNLSHDPEQEYFADGMTEALTTELSQISSLKVISRTSAMHYKGSNKPLPEIAKALNVDGIIEGSVLRADGRVRINAQLVNAATDTDLWAKSYERDLRDVLRLQGEIARAIADEVKANSVAPRATASKGPVNPQAYELYLRGREHLNYGDETEFRQTIEYLNRAIVLDTGYAPAYASLAMAYTQMGFFSAMSRDEASQKAKEAAARALALDDGLAEAHTANAYATFLFDWDWRGPDLEFRRSLELNPNSADAHLLYSIYLTFCGRFDDGIRENQIAIKLDPLNSYVNFNLGWTYFEARRYAEGISFMHELQRRDPDYPFAHHHLAGLYAGQGKCAEALAEAEHDRSFDEAFIYATCGQSERALRLLRDAERVVARAKLDPFYPAWMNATLGRRDEAFRWLDRAIQEHSIQVVFIRTAPELDNIRSDPRFAIALRRVGAN